MLPGPSRRAVPACTNGVPGREPEVGMLRSVLSTLQGVGTDVALGEIGHGIAAWLEEHDGVLTIGNPGSAEADAHAPTQRLDVQQSLRQRFGHEEPADWSR